MRTSSRTATLALIFYTVGMYSAAPVARAEPIFREVLGLKHHSATVTELEDGALLATWYYGDDRHGEGDRGGALLASLRPAPGEPAGGRWSELFVLYDSPRKAEGNPVLHYSPERGKLLLFTGTMHSPPQGDPNCWDCLTTHFFEADVRRAADIDLTRFAPIRWGRPLTLAAVDLAPTPEPGPPVPAARWEPLNLSDRAQAARALRGFVLRNKPVVAAGHLVLPIYFHSAGRSTSGVMRMNLESAEWSPTVFVPAETPNVEQPTLAPLSDGALLMFNRNTLPEGRNPVWTSRSSDGGATWEKITAHPFLTNENNSLDLLTLPDGRLLLVHNEDRTRTRLNLSLSEDGGQTWITRTLDEADAELSYPSMILSRDGQTVHIVYSYFRRTIAHYELKISKLKDFFN